MAVDISSGPDTVNEISACMVGPAFATHEAQIRAMVRSIRFVKR